MRKPTTRRAAQAAVVATIGLAALIAGGAQAEARKPAERPKPFFSSESSTPLISFGKQW